MDHPPVGGAADAPGSSPTALAQHQPAPAQRPAALRNARLVSKRALLLGTPAVAGMALSALANRLEPGVWAFTTSLLLAALLARDTRARSVAALIGVAWLALAGLLVGLRNELELGLTAYGVPATPASWLSHPVWSMVAGFSCLAFALALGRRDDDPADRPGA